MAKPDDGYRDATNIAHLKDPAWDRADKVHDWRNHVGEKTRRMWDTFSDIQRLALAADADERAQAEDWD